jgi:hypothetical protein
MELDGYDGAQITTPDRLLMLVLLNQVIALVQVLI